MTLLAYFWPEPIEKPRNRCGYRVLDGGAYGARKNAAMVHGRPGMTAYALKNQHFSVSSVRACSALCAVFRHRFGLLFGPRAHGEPQSVLT